MNNRTLFVGKFSQDDVESRFSNNSARKTKEDLEKKVTLEWIAMKEKALKDGKKIWDQDLYRLEGFSIKNNTCVLDFGTIAFSTRIALNSFTDDLLSLSQDYFPMGAYSSIFVETNDRKFVFIEKSNKYFSRRKFSFIGGVFNKAYNDDVHSLFSSAKNEVLEELGITDKSSLEGISLIGSFINQTCNVCFVFYCKLSVSEDEIRRNFDSLHDLEVEKLIFLTRGNLETFVMGDVGMRDTIINILKLSEL